MRLLHLVATGALVACTNTLPTVPANTEFTVRVGESVTVAGAGLTITFLRVSNDSRCPTDVVCVWAGNGQIQLQVRGGATDTLTLNTYDGAKEGVAGAWRIKFIVLAPAPVSSRPIEPGDYRATLVVVPVGARLARLTRIRPPHGSPLLDAVRRPC